MAHKKTKRVSVPASVACQSIGDLRKAFVHWVASLSEEEAQRPVIIVQGRTYTPAQVLEEIDQETRLGAILAEELIELGIKKPI
jgi:hypothetical protein